MTDDPLLLRLAFLPLFSDYRLRAVSVLDMFVDVVAVVLSGEAA